MKDMFSIMSYIQTHYDFILDFQNADQHTVGK